MLRLADVEREVASLHGVRAVNLEHDEVEGMSLRVLVVPERSREATVRDVRSAATRLGVDIAPAYIEVLGTGENRPRGNRRKLASLSAERSGGRFTARVSLELAGDILRGESEGAAGTRSERRLIAEAILDATRGVLSFSPYLESVSVHALGTFTVAVVCLCSEDEVLLGCARMGHDERDTIARATLDALNRRLGRNL